MPENNENIEQITDSILNSIKKMLGLMPDNKEFDADIIMNINSALFVLSQLGVGANGFYIEDEEKTYNEYLPDNPEMIHPVKMYLYAKVRLGFDISTTSAAVIEQLKQQANEYEWRLMAQAEFNQQ